MPMLYGNYVFKTDLKLEDFKELSWLLVKKSMLFLVLLIDLFFCYTMYKPLGKNFLILSAVFVALFIALYYFEKFYINWKAKKIFNANTVSREITLTLSETGIVQESRKGETELLWEDVLRVCSSKNLYFVFLNKKQAFYFPKRSFKDRDDEKMFCDLIIEKVDPIKVRF